MTMKEVRSLVAHAQNNLLVNDVKMIFVNFIHVKIMGLVLLILLMAKKHQHATVLKILLDQIVTCCFAVPMMYLVIMVVHAKSTQLAMKTFGSTIQIWNVLWNYWILESRKVVNAFKRMDSQNIMVKVVKSLVVMHALEIHVRMVVRVRKLSKVKLRTVLQIT